MTLDERTEFGGPLSQIVKFSVESKTSISGDKARIETRTICGNALMKMFCPGDSAQIIRLDNDTTYQLDLKKKTYFEETFADFRARQRAAAEQMRKAQDAQPQPAAQAAPDPNECEWLPPKSDVQRTGEKGRIGGFEAERATITVVQPCREKRTGSVCEVRWVSDQWLTTAEVGGAEQQRFWQAYARKLTQDMAGTGTTIAQAMAYMEKYKDTFAELQKKMQSLQGHPVKSTLQLSTGGPECKEAQEALAQQADAGTPAAEKPSVGGAIAGALGGSLGSSLFNRAKKKEPAAEPAKTEAAAAPAAPAYATLFEMTNEVRGVSAGPASPDLFEIPAGFKKVAAPALPDSQ